MRNISEKQSIEEVEVCEGNHQHQLEYLKNRMPKSCLKCLETRPV